MSTEATRRDVERLGTAPEPDPGTDSMFERTLRRTPAERLADAVRIARFVLRGREKLQSVRDGHG